MKLLFDQNISFRIEKKISAIFLDSKHISNVGLLNKEDIEIWTFAKLNGFTIVTFDSDFFDLSIVKGTPPKIIWFRSGNAPTDKIAEILHEKHQTIRDFIENIDKAEISCLEIK